MARFITVVLDGFGVGVMADYADFNPCDQGAHTLGSILKCVPELNLPTLMDLGLMNIAGFESHAMKFSQNAVFGKSKLKHFGADTFFGHQEMMGSVPVRPETEPFYTKIDVIEQTLQRENYQVRRIKASDLLVTPADSTQKSNHEILVVNEAATIADNLESYAGHIYNVTSSLDLLSFDEIVKVGRIVRSVVNVPRVIAFGGENVSLKNILDAVEVKGDDFIGINAPKSGVYLKNYHVIHLGFGVDFTKQAPYVLAQHQIPTYLLGKVADIVETNLGVAFPAVDTTEVLQQTLLCMDEFTTGFMCSNVQETDLAGHAEDAILYAERLKIADAYLAKIIQKMAPEDVLIVTADHGNDPLIGHKGHTREYVPVMIYSQNLNTQNSGLHDIGVRETLADIAKTAVCFLGIQEEIVFGKPIEFIIQSCNSKLQ